MPEVKEIRKFADFIKKKIKNKKIIEINILNGRYKKHAPFVNYNLLIQQLPLKVIDVKTKGKFLYIILSKNLYLFNTLGLSGGWCYQKNNSNNFEFSDTLDEYTNYLPEQSISNYLTNAINHLNVEFKTNYGSLYFYDVLSFGTLKIVDDEKHLNKKLNEIGPDIMDDNTDLFLFKNQILNYRNLNKEIGIVLLNQKVISGIGNYLRSEILYISKINPFTQVSQLTNLEIKKIYNNSKIATWGDYDKKKALELNIINKRTKFPSDFNRMFFVYNQKKDIYNNNVIKKELYEGSKKRFIYYVPEIQL